MSAAGGSDWPRARRTEVVKAYSAVELQSPDPRGLAERWSSIAEIPLREDKRGQIPADLPPILERLQIDPRYWLHMANNFEGRFKGLVGAAYRLKAACARFNVTLSWPQRLPNGALMSSTIQRTRPFRQSQASGKAVWRHRHL